MGGCRTPASCWLQRTQLVIIFQTSDALPSRGDILCESPGGIGCWPQQSLEAALAKAGLWFAEIFEAMFSKAFAAKVFAKTILIGGLIVELARSDYFQNAADRLAAILAKDFPARPPTDRSSPLKLTRQIGTEVSSSQSIIVIQILCSASR